MSVCKIPWYAIALALGTCTADKPHYVASASQTLRNGQSPSCNFHGLAASDTETPPKFIFYANIFPLTIFTRDEHMRFVFRELCRDISGNVHLPNVVRAILECIRKAPQSVNFHQRIARLRSCPGCGARRNKPMDNEGIFFNGAFLRKFVPQLQRSTGGLLRPQAFSSF